MLFVSKSLNLIICGILRITATLKHRMLTELKLIKKLKNIKAKVRLIC